jgi:phosphonate transport system ATP-binding protein
MGLWASLRSLFYPTDIPAAYAALVHFDLGDKLFERVDRLSGGERQRVGLARALLAPASLWLIDEPLSALDPMRSRMAMSALVDLARERQTTLVATLHQVDMALSHFPRIIGLRDGQVVFDLPAEQVSPERLAHLYDQHEHELRGDALPAARQEATPEAPAPVVMHCR